MGGLNLSYAGALLRSAPLASVARAAVRRGWRWGRAVVPATGDEARRARAALERAPRIFGCHDRDFLASYQLLVAGGSERSAERAARLLAHQVELFGRWHAIGAPPEWQRDPLSGRQFEPRLQPGSSDLGELPADPKPVWELGRSAHLIELGCAARLHPELAPAARAEVTAQLEAFLAQNPTGLGIHFVSPLDAAVRAFHWLGAVELLGGVAALETGFAQRLAAALLEHGRFLEHHLEDLGVVPANHLLGELVGLFVLGLALDGVPGTSGWRQVSRRMLREAARQVGPDGADFEGSTAYHRFVLELLLAAELWASRSGEDLGLRPTLSAMFRFVRAYLAPDGSEPGIGDSDDSRVFPFVPRPPRDHQYLLSIGASLLGDPALKPPGDCFSEEALWLLGPSGLVAWRRLETTPWAPSVSCPGGGLHILRAENDYVLVRAGCYGQAGVGGHGHNDQLALVVHAGGRPLVIDPGTYCYTADALDRDRFRSTAAHSTVLVDGEEQSPILDDRPFALPDRAHGQLLRLIDDGARAELVAEHRGYERLPCRAVHRRQVTWWRAPRLLVIEDRLVGRGKVWVEARFQVVDAARIGLGDEIGRRVREQARSLGLAALDLDRAVEIGPPEQPTGVLVPLGDGALSPTIAQGSWSPRYGEALPHPTVIFAGTLELPGSSVIALLLLG